MSLVNDNKYPQVVWNRKIPLRYEADVAIIGGGIAGVSAACAAAKTGAKVMLVERFAVTGGNGTVGGVNAFCGETSGQGEIFDDIVAGLEAFKAIAPYRPYKHHSASEARVFDHEILSIVLQELLLKNNVKLLLHTRFVDVCVDNGSITECVICGKSGPEALRAKQFIDCTGEGELAFAAGFETMKGRQSDGLQLPMSMMFFVRHVSNEEAYPQVPKGWFNSIESAEQLPMTSVWPNGLHSNAIKIKVPMFDSTDTESITSAEITARRRMMEVLDYYQRSRENCVLHEHSADVAGLRKQGKAWMLDHCSAQIGIREGRRVKGEYILTHDDVKNGCIFEDAIAKGVFYLDAHKPDDDKRTSMLDKKDSEIPPYQIPLRSLIVKDAKNLMVAGRCFSADQIAMSSARVMTTCSMMGQAAGISAALCAIKGCSIKDIDALEVRREVEKHGAQIEL